MKGKSVSYKIDLSTIKQCAGLVCVTRCKPFNKYGILKGNMYYYLLFFVVAY